MLWLLDVCLDNSPAPWWRQAAQEESCEDERWLRPLCYSIYGRLKKWSTIKEIVCIQRSTLFKAYLRQSGKSCFQSVYKGIVRSHRSFLEEGSSARQTLQPQEPPHTHLKLGPRDAVPGQHRRFYIDQVEPETDCESGDTAYSSCAGRSKGYYYKKATHLYFLWKIQQQNSN